MVFPGKAAGALVEGASAFINPGRKNEAGETLWLALMPPHPVEHNTSASSIANPGKILFILTCLV